jgi:hypothetical protein
VRGNFAGLIAVVLVGCGSPPEPVGPDAALPPDAAVDSVPFTPDTCHGTPLSLYGMSGNADPTIVGPYTVDTTGTTICLSLDARDNIRIAHFAANTAYETAGASSFELALFTMDDVLLREGWDVQFGSNPTTSFANLEFGVTVGTILDTKLVVRARSGTATTQIPLHLFEPYE